MPRPNNSSGPIKAGPLEVTFETITPAIAKEYMTKNFENNRKLNPMRVNTLAEEIKRGEWIVNGATICFNAEGFLTDGQTRLSAVIKSGRPIETLVVRELPIKSFYTIDSGTKRSPADVLHIAGEINAAMLACAARYLYSWDRGHNFGSAWRERISAQLIQSALRKHPKLRDSCAYIGTRSLMVKTGGPSLLAAFHYLINEISEKETNGFLDGYLQGIDLCRGHPVLALRNQMLVFAQGPGIRRDPKFISQLFLKAWNMFARGERHLAQTFTVAPEEEKSLETLAIPPANKGHHARYGITPMVDSAAT